MDRRAAIFNDGVVRRACTRVLQPSKLRQWVLLNLCRTENRWVTFGYEINICPTSCQQFAHIVPSPTTYLQVP